MLNSASQRDFSTTAPVFPFRHIEEDKAMPKSSGGVIFRRFRKGKDGKILDAWEYGYKAWPIRPTPPGKRKKK